MQISKKYKVSSEEIDMMALYDQLTSEIKESEDIYPAVLEIVTPLATSNDVLESLEEVSASSQLPDHVPYNLLTDSKTDFHAHFLSDKTMFITLHFDPNNEVQLAILDNFTSTVIRYGGTLRTGKRSSLNVISPHLSKRINGEYSINMQEQIKLLFDPNDVMSRNRMFWA